jgi:hypothetical protein
MCTWEMRNSYKTLIVKSERKKPPQLSTGGKEKNDKKDRR